MNDALGTPVNTADVTVTDTNGDGTGDAILTFPNGESIQLNGILPSAVATPDQLEAIGIPAAPIVTLYDAIELNGGAPGAGTTLLTGTGDLVEIDEPIEFSTSIAAQIQAGDIAVIDGVTYTVTDITTLNTTYTHSDGLGGTTDSTVKSFGINLDDGSGGTLSYIIPHDPSGTLEDISQVVVLTTDPETNISEIDIDTNDSVTLIPADGTVHGLSLIHI